MGKLKTDADFLCISHVDSILSHNDKACDVGFIAAYMFHKNRKAVDLSASRLAMAACDLSFFLSYLAGAMAVLAASTPFQPGCSSRKGLHCASPCGWEKTVLISDSSVSGSPSRTCSTGMICSPTM